MASRFSGLLWLGLVVLWTASASAAPTASERETARGFMIEGDRLRDASDLPGALQQYQAAHALMHVPTTGLAVADVLARLGQLVEAQSVVQEVLGMPVAPPEPAAFVKAREAAVVLASTLAERVCKLHTHVQPLAAQYRLEIDDVALAEDALTVPLKLDPGTHTLRVRAPGYATQTRQLSLPEGGVQHVEIALTALPLEAATEPAAPQTAAQAGYAMQLDRDRQSGRVRGFIGLGIGGVALAVGIITGAVSWNQASDLKRHCDPDRLCSAALSGELQTANTLGHIANVSVPLGLVGIAYGLYELLTLPEAAPAASHAALHFDVSPNAVVLRGRL